MITITDKSKCSGCHACVNACPKNCIQMLLDDEGFLYPSVNIDQCVDCGLCEKVCPIIHKWLPDDDRTTSAIAAINNNEKVRLNSSSGGIFTLIAEAILDQDGVVFGAAFAEDFKSVHHIYVDNKIDLAKLRGSKYVQSKIGDTYKIAKEFLDSGRIVLFTGTPCQIGGLYSYLRKPYDNLYTQDIICHGVPSPMVWKKYVEERERKASSKLSKVYFRYKKYGWKTFAMYLSFLDNKTFIKTLYEDSFMRAFLSNSCLRPSCYSCAFKSVQRQADISLADFWGIPLLLPEMDDNKGTSLVLIHSRKGSFLIDRIKQHIKFKTVDIEKATNNNRALIHSANYNAKRNEYMAKMHSMDIDELSNNLFPISTKKKIINLLSKIGLHEKYVRAKLRIKRK